MSYQSALSAATSDKPKWEMSGAAPGYYLLKTREILGYSSVDFAMNLVFQAIMMYITFFYTDIFGLRVADVTLMFLLSRFVDAFADPIMGTIAERSNPSRGKYKSWLIYGAVPFGVMAVLTYTTPNFSYGWKLLWAYVTYNLLNILYSVIINPYISLASVMTADPAQRTKLQSVRMMCAQSGGVIVALALPLVSSRNSCRCRAATWSPPACSPLSWLRPCSGPQLRWWSESRSPPTRTRPDSRT